jgi:hypothetical protein
MATDDLTNFARRLQPVCDEEDGDVFVSESTLDADLARASESLRGSVGELFREIRAGIPTDFSFNVSFTTDGIELGVDFEDGNTGGNVFRARFTSRKSMRRKLRRVPWDECRKHAMEQGSIFEDMLREADDRPPAIPVSEEVAREHKIELERAKQAVRGDAPIPQFCVIAWREDCGVEVEKQGDRQTLIGLIADMMTTGYDILAVLERGVDWTFEEIEEAKLEAVEGLGPISRAKAERRFFA